MEKQSKYIRSKNIIRKKVSKYLFEHFHGKIYWVKKCPDKKMLCYVNVAINRAKLHNVWFIKKIKNLFVFFNLNLLGQEKSQKKIFVFV